MTSQDYCAFGARREEQRCQRSAAAKKVPKKEGARAAVGMQRSAAYSRSRQRHNNKIPIIQLSFVSDSKAKPT